MSIRRTVSFSDPQMKWLRQQAKALGITVADVIRRVVDSQRLDTKSIRTPPKRKFTLHELHDKIRKSWPVLGDRASREFARCLWNSEEFSATWELDDFGGSKDGGEPNAHDLYLAARLCFSSGMITSANKTFRDDWGFYELDEQVVRIPIDEVNVGKRG